MSAPGWCFDKHIEPEDNVITFEATEDGAHVYVNGSRWAYITYLTGEDPDSRVGIKVFGVNWTDADIYVYGDNIEPTAIEEVESPEIDIMFRPNKKLLKFEEEFPEPRFDWSHYG